MFFVCLFFPITLIWNGIFFPLSKILHQILLFLPESLTLLFSSWTESESLLLVASQSQLIAGNITRQGYFIYPVIQHGSHIVAVDFDSVSGRIFWSDGTQGKIWSAFQNGTDRKLVST